MIVFGKGGDAMADDGLTDLILHNHRCLVTRRGVHYP